MADSLILQATNVDSDGYYHYEVGADADGKEVVLRCPDNTLEVLQRDAKKYTDFCRQGNLPGVQERANKIERIVQLGIQHKFSSIQLKGLFKKKLVLFCYCKNYELGMTPDRYYELVTEHCACLMEAALSSGNKNTDYKLVSKGKDPTFKGRRGNGRGHHKTLNLKLNKSKGR